MPSHRIVIAGGGVAGLEAAVALRALGGEGLEIDVVCPGNDFSFPAHQVAEPFASGPPVRLGLEELLAGLHVRHLDDAAAAVVVEERRLDLASGASVTYDGLLLALGGTPFPAYAHGITFDRPGDPEPFDELLKDVEGGLVRDVAFVVPDATGWTLPAYDLTLILRAWAGRRGHDVRIRLVTPERCALEAFGEPVSAKVEELLARFAIELIPGTEPVLISDVSMLAGDHWITADRIVSLPRLAGPRLPGVPCDWSGFIEVDETGAVTGCPGVYAVGDGAAHARKQGGLAAQQADLAARALLREAGVAVPEPDEPVSLRGVLATPDGPLFLQSRHGYGTETAHSVASFIPLWDPPSKVATRWLGRHVDGVLRQRITAFAA